MVKIIAEIGCNHLGDMDKAKKLIDAAASAGANYAKFQMFVVDKINDPSIHDFLYKSFLTQEQHYELKEYCKSRSINYLCSAFDVESIKNLAEIGCDTIKIPSGQIHNKAYLETIAQYSWHILASTGMCDLVNIQYATCILSYYCSNYTLFSCTSAYPCPLEDANLKKIKQLRLIGHTNGIGFSDHTMSFCAAPMAVAMGADWIEHHIRLTGQHGSPDVPVSFSPIRMLHYIHCIREAEVLLGSDEFKIADSEKEMLHRRDFRTF